MFLFSSCSCFSMDVEILFCISLNIIQSHGTLYTYANYELQLTYSFISTASSKRMVYVL